jgi:hypothetical protein
MFKNEGLYQLVTDFIDFYPRKSRRYDGIYEDFLYFMYQLFSNKINNSKSKSLKTKYTKNRSEIIKYVLNNKNEILSFIHNHQSNTKK